MISKIIESLQSKEFKVFKSVDLENSLTIYKNSFQKVYYTEINSPEYKQYKKYKNYDYVVFFFLDKNEYCWINLQTNKFSSEIDLNDNKKFSYLFYRINKRKIERPSKEDLLKMLWEEPTTSIAKKYGVSDKAIEKWAKAYNLNKPPRGFWTKKVK